MMKKSLHIIVFILITIILFSSFTYAQSKKIEVKVIVPPMQELTINEAVSISFDYPWEGMECGQPLILENIGDVSIKSNVDWFLNISSKQYYRDLEIYIRPASVRNIDWQRIDSSGAIISGNSGLKDISWDIKIVYLRENYILARRSLNREKNYNDIRNINMIFTLTQL